MAGHWPRKCCFAIAARKTALAKPMRIIYICWMASWQLLHTLPARTREIAVAKPASPAVWVAVQEVGLPFPCSHHPCAACSGTTTQGLGRPCGLWGSRRITTSTRSFLLPSWPQQTPGAWTPTTLLHYTITTLTTLLLPSLPRLRPHRVYRLEALPLARQPGWPRANGEPCKGGGALVVRPLPLQGLWRAERASGPGLSSFSFSL